MPPYKAPFLFILFITVIYDTFTHDKKNLIIIFLLPISYRKIFQFSIHLKIE